MRSKYEQLKEFSDPEIVAHKAQELGLNPMNESSRKDKKFMVFDGHKMQHFGQMGYYDYTRTLDKEKRDRFRKRNHKWANSPKYSPAWLSYYLLW